MSVKSIILKIVASVTVIGVLLGAIVLLSREEESAEKESVTVYASNEEDIIRVEVDSTEKYALLKENDSWIMEGMEGIGVNNAYAKTLVKSMANINSPMIVAEDCENLSDYGFDNPKVSVKLFYSDGEETIRVGNQSGEYYYINVLSSPDVYLMAENDLYMLFLDKIKYIDSTVVSIDESEVSEISFGDISLVRDGDNWIMTNPYNITADSDAVKNSVLKNINLISADEILKADRFTGERVEILLNDGEKVNLTVSRESDGYRYILKENSDYVYKVKSDYLSFLEVPAYSLILKYVAPVPITEVVKIDFVSSKKRTTIEIEAPSTEAPVFYKDGKEVEQSVFRQFYQTLMGLNFSGEGSVTAPSEYAIIFTKETGEILDLRFIPLNDSEYVVDINGKTHFKVLKKSVTDIFKAVDELETI
ncbi:MAG: DUF4340 domain-containing protein [Clostridia bacterium]